MEILIIGADILFQHQLLVDLNSRFLRDGVTDLTTKDQSFAAQLHSSRAIDSRHGDRWASILQSFPEVLQPYGRRITVTHNPQHHVRTTPGQPVSSNVRRLAPDKLKIAQTELSNMLKHVALLRVLGYLHSI